MCPVCHQRPAEVGVLCEECRDELSSPIKIMPEQLQLHSTRPTMAAMIDLWGRPHRLDPRTLIGRQVDGHGLAILEPSVSRHHAHLTLDRGQWSLRDLGSANGTFLDDVMISTSVAVHEGSRLRFGHIAFYFVGDVARLPMPQLGRTMTATIDPTGEAPRPAGKTVGAPPPRDRASPIDPTGEAPRPAGKTVGAPTPRDRASPIDTANRRADSPALSTILPDPDDVTLNDDDEERTDVGLPVLSFKLHEPTGGGGGLVEIEGKQVQLTMTQFEFMALMIKRMASELHQPELVRGFVRSSELIADLSWDTREPSENHVKQLVRRVRRALQKSEIGDLIESRHRFGYRLRAIPRE